MEHFTSRSLGRAAALACFAVVGTGCFGKGNLPLVGADSSKSSAAAKQSDCIEAVWLKEVIMAPDIQRNGAPAPGLAGKLYIFGPDVGKPKLVEGNVIIDLYDDTPRGENSTPRHIEQWRFEGNTLAPFLKRDLVGDVYSLLLPWGTYSRDIRRVHFAVRYEPANAAPVTTTSGTISLEHPMVPAGSHPAQLPPPIVTKQ
jgi:hypothetical protein